MRVYGQGHSDSLVSTEGNWQRAERGRGVTAAQPERVAQFQACSPQRNAVVAAVAVVPLCVLRV